MSDKSNETFITESEVYRRLTGHRKPIDIRPQLRRVLPLLKRIHDNTLWVCIVDDNGVEHYLFDAIETRKLAEFIEAAEQLLMEE